ncbi:MAG: C2 family cysteine protease [Planctomyces sp.]
MVLNGGLGNDTLIGAAGPDVIRGGADKDQLHGSGGNDRLYGDGGIDVLWGGHGGDFLDAGSATEKVFGFGADAAKSEKDYNAWQPVIRGISSDDVHQDREKNCAFLATLSSVAATSTVDLARGISYKGNDRFTVTFAGQPNKPIEVIFNGSLNLDDPLPNPKVHPDGEFWTILYWRAFSRAYGGPAYVPTIILPDPLKNPSVALQALTGKTPSEANRRISQLWNDAQDQAAIATALAAKRAVVAGTLDGSSVVAPFVKAHSYAVIRFTPARSGREATVTLRNPWGHNGDGNRNLRGEFSVPWSAFRASIGKFFISR